MAVLGMAPKLLTDAKAEIGPSAPCIDRIVHMPSVHLRNLDLNLLVPLHAAAGGTARHAGGQANLP